MPTVEKTEGGRVDVRGLGEYTLGERDDVSGDWAEYLVEERGDFEYVDDDQEDSGEAPEPVTHTLEDTIEAGKCPWCNDYGGDNVGQHASSAHPDEWDAYKED